ncbi:PREDICTED: two-component response regulator-like APRR3 isoform X2 [Nicotiana attenuata]|nr:PREDICTED: two-component response regulator-like APRR3 isoform X2 [Nicotiana attenuata]XP_019252142.1 PREDICTED: two-component response regulator-like APRR3 isoform X2 [Nicotiana attenuata]
MCKNIPVIMMSSKDSISTVLKCMVKGASDFLMKPVRKNELRNLWQHVWRRKNQSAGSRPQNKVVENQKVAVSENEAASNYSSDNLASIQRGYDKSSDAQGIKDIRCRDASNTCDEECVEMVERSFMPKSKPLANMTSSGIGTSSCTGPYSSVAISSEEGSLCAEPRSHSENTCTVDEVDCRLYELSSAPCTEAVDLIGKFENCLADNGHSDERKEKSNVASRLGLCLRTFNPSCSNDDGSREQNMISHSKVSAFAKYENKKTIQYLFSGLTSNSGPFKEGSSASTLEHVASLTESEHNATALVMRQPGNCKAAISDNQLSFIPVESGYQQVQSPKSQSPLPTSSLTYSYSEVQNLEHDKQPFDDTTVHSEDNVEEAGNLKLVAEKERNDSAICGSSDMGSGVTNKLSSSRCGSTSNEAIESSSAVASPGRDPVSESVNYNDILQLDRTRGESHSTSQREAALVKFRLKRKDRCFEKKVRYQSRKRLAEQRPRVKGQFVRQLQNEAQS